VRIAKLYDINGIAACARYAVRQQCHDTPPFRGHHQLSVFFLFIKQAEILSLFNAKYPHRTATRIMTVLGIFGGSTIKKLDISPVFTAQILSERGRRRLCGRINAVSVFQIF